ncbi:MAG: DUF1553 domain-containing protein, partial [Candidatus Ratteibacteria bacterium]
MNKICNVLIVLRTGIATSTIPLIMLLLVYSFSFAQIKTVSLKPYEDDFWITPENIVDLQVEACLARYDAKLRNPCSDYVFIRRVYLDTIGTLPTPEEIDAFTKDTRQDKRKILIDHLLDRDEFALYWTMKWCDILRVKSEYPINLWPNAVQAYHRWIYEQIKKNLPYDQFVRELLTSSGSNFRVPQVNFYRAIQGRSPLSIAKAVAMTFMGINLDKLPRDAQENMAMFFSRVAYKKTLEWKEEIVYFNPEPGKTIRTSFLDGRSVEILPEQDGRIIFADWLISPKNPYFNKNIVNRVWTWLMGNAIISPVDDIYGKKTPGQEVLTVLEQELVKSGYDIKHLIRLILNSRTYQQSSIPTLQTKNPEIQFAFYKIRQLEAEVLLDALCWIGGSGEEYVSQIPEPYTFIPKENRNIGLADGSITSSFLITFGRPSRDTGLESERNSNPTDKQRLYMLNSSDIQKK